MSAVARKLGVLLLTALVASFVIFAALYAAPGDPVSFLIGDPEKMTPERIAEVRAQYHLNDPFLKQYLLWLWDVLRGDLGSSFVYQQPVSELMASRLPVTLTLVVMASVIFLAIGVALGIVSALRRGRATDGAITGLTTFLGSVPNFVIGLVLVAVFSVKLMWFPVAGSGAGFTERVHHLVLPAIALALGSLAVISRVTRQTMSEQMDLEHVEVAHSFGLSGRAVVRRHILRNALAPIVTMSGLIMAGMLGGTVVVETVFGLSGLGSLVVEAINAHDFPVVQAVLLYMVIAYMVVTTLTDLLHPLLDPRIKSRRAAA